jgi:hypothetical protein
MFMFLGYFTLAFLTYFLLIYLWIVCRITLFLVLESIKSIATQHGREETKRDMIRWKKQLADNDPASEEYLNRYMPR